MDFFKAKIISNAPTRADDRSVFSMWAANEGKPAPRPGQFYMLKTADPEPLLGRPLGVCEVKDGKLGFCYQVVGDGTVKLSRLREGDEIFLTGPLGNGFDVASIKAAGRVALVSGGMGIAPFVELSRHVNADLFCGFADKPVLAERVSCAKYITSTESGREGAKGLVTDFLNPADYDLVIACGPRPMLKAVVGKCKAAGVKSLVSTESYMACGVGACLTCTCETVHGYKRCCADGPVFDGEELIL